MGMDMPALIANPHFSLPLVVLFFHYPSLSFFLTSATFVFLHSHLLLKPLNVSHHTVFLAVSSFLLTTVAMIPEILTKYLEKYQ